MDTIIYTIGHGNIPLQVFINRLHSHHINCVVDIRREQNTEAQSCYNAEVLSQVLKVEGIIFLSFFNEFGFIPQDARNKYGQPLYSKVSKLDSFQQGISRLYKGIEKGYTIALMDSPEPIYDGTRHLIIGKELHSKGIRVMHIDANGTAISYENVEDILKRRADLLLSKKESANDLGRNGEEIAAMHLMRNGHTVLHHNWNLHHGCELDIVTRKDGILHFVEVKTRSSDERGTPHQAITYKKMQNIHRAIKHYLATYQYDDDMPIQVDSIAIVYKDENDYTIDIKEGIHY